MGLQIAAQSAVIGGQADPAQSTKDNSGGGPFNGKWCPIPPNHGTVDTWYCIGYHHDGASPPTQTWVAFVKQKASETSVTINGATFDLRGVEQGEWMLYTAYGNGNVANPWSVSYAISVFRQTGGHAGVFPVFFIGNGLAYDFTISAGITTVTQFGLPLSTPFVTTYDSLDGPVYDPLNINNGFLTGVWWTSPFGFSTGASLGAFTLVVGAGSPVYTTDAWAPSGLGATGSQPPQSWFQSQGVNQEWGLPDQADLQCREISASDQVAEIPKTLITASGVENFFVQCMPNGSAELADIAARVFGRAVTSYGTRDLLATRVRPQFIDQTNEGGGGIFLETNNS